MPKPGAQVPTIPEGTRRMVICVPDSIEWLTLVTGCLAQLHFGWYWNKDSGDWEAARERAQRMYFEFQDQNGLCDVLDCDEVAECIETSEAVQNALNAYVSNNYNSGVAGSGPMSEADQNADLLSQAGCNNDIAWGNALNIVQSLNRRNADFLETLEALTNNQEAIDYIIDAIPVLETLPIDDFIIVADKVREWLADAYLAGYDIDYELERACEIFCLITNSPTCELTYAQLRDFYWNKARALSVFEDAFTSAVQIIEAWANWDETFGEIVVDVMCAMQFGFLNFLNSAFGYTFKQFKVQASSGIPDDDWTINCDDCPLPFSPVLQLLDATCFTGSPDAVGENLVYDEINGIWEADGTTDTITNTRRVCLMEAEGRAFKFNTFTSSVAIGGAVWVQASTPTVCEGGAAAFPPEDTALLGLIWVITENGTPLHVGFNFYE